MAVGEAEPAIAKIVDRQRSKARKALLLRLLLYRSKLSLVEIQLGYTQIGDRDFKSFHSAPHSVSYSFVCRFDYTLL